MCIAAGLLSGVSLVIELVILFLERHTVSPTLLLVDFVAVIFNSVAFFVGGNTGVGLIFLFILAQIIHLASCRPDSEVSKHTPSGLKAAASISISFYYAVNNEIASTILLFIGGVLITGVLLWKSINPDEADKVDKFVAKEAQSVIEDIEKATGKITAAVTNKQQQQQQQLPKNGKKLS